jgi:pyruvate-ferredoxin/flavodoxin oxidoreductase
MTQGMQNQKLAVESGHWPLFRFNPDRAKRGENPLTLDSKAPSVALKEYAYRETRYKMLTKSRPEDAARLMEQAQRDVRERWNLYDRLARTVYGAGAGNGGEGETAGPEVAGGTGGAGAGGAA